ncbi:hypothetical protein [Pimelobacter simplex]|uniref:hypothetical protein n=1 Tax=Nocardioides simplex TaxID=2045 RepID=UPI0019344C14|nr:hypothetical protein [Pimelobacter simplex]
MELARRGAIAALVGTCLLAGCSGAAERPRPDHLAASLPAPSVTYESPGPGDHPIGLSDIAGALVLTTLERLDRPGPATIWRKEPGGWRRLGTLEHATPPERLAPQRTRLSPGPGSHDVLALHLAGGRVGFSRDGGASWTYLARPAGCRAGGCSEAATADHLYVTKGRVTLRAAFGADAWEAIALPGGSGSPDRYVGLLALADALLTIATDCDTTTNHYWVSRDDGSTWSERRDFPPGTCIYGRVDDTPYTADARETQWWRSTDLVHWAHAPTNPFEELSARASAACPASGRRTPVTGRAGEPPVRIGAEVYRLFRLGSRDARKLELKVSRDDCRTWTPALP